MRTHWFNWKIFSGHVSKKVWLLQQLQRVSRTFNITLALYILTYLHKKVYFLRGISTISRVKEDYWGIIIVYYCLCLILIFQLVIIVSCFSTRKCILIIPWCISRPWTYILQYNYSTGLTQAYRIISYFQLDLDECLDHPCDKNATCSNTIGSFNCTCNKGFEGDGKNCEGIEIFLWAN